MEADECIFKIGEATMTLNYVVEELTLSYGSYEEAFGGN